MKKHLILALSYLVAGVVLSTLFLLKSSPDLMLKEDPCKYSFDECVSRFEAAVLEKGWTIPTVHDLQKSLQKHGKEVNRVKVFAICSPEHAVKILKGDNERVVSSMMPCRVAIYEKSDGRTYASRMNSGLFARGMKRNVRTVMKTAYSDTEEILAAIIE